MRILVVVGRYPWPSRRGDQLRAAQALSALSAAHEVTLLAPRPVAAPPPPLRLAGIETYRFAALPLRLAAVLGAGLAGAPLQQGLFASRDLARRLARLAPQADLVLLQLARLERFAALAGGRPVLLDLIDSLALNLETRAERDRPVLRPFLRAEARRLGQAEDRLVDGAARALLVGGRDREAIAARRPDLAERLTVLPLAVELPMEERSAPSAMPPGAPARLIFTGNLGYFPNLDAARWLLAELWPAIRAAHPGVGLMIAGDRPGPGLRRAARTAGVELIASPPSVAELLATATVALAPLRCGSGVPVKVLEAWAAGVPVVASPWAAAGAGPGAESALAVAAEPDEWRTRVSRLVTDRAERDRLVAEGRERLRRYHSVAQVAGAWLEEVERALAAGSPGRRAEP